MTALTNKIKEVVSKSAEYYNTNNITGNELKQAEKKVSSQAKIIYNLLKERKKLTASQVYLLYPDQRKMTPLTSIRRALTNLKNAGLIEKTTEKRTGIYGAKEYYYQIVN